MTTHFDTWAEAAADLCDDCSGPVGRDGCFHEGRQLCAHCVAGCPTCAYDRDRGYLEALA